MSRCCVIDGLQIDTPIMLVSVEDFTNSGSNFICKLSEPFRFICLVAFCLINNLAHLWSFIRFRTLLIFEGKLA